MLLACAASRGAKGARTYAHASSSLYLVCFWPSQSQCRLRYEPRSPRLWLFWSASARAHGVHTHGFAGDVEDPMEAQ